MTQDAKPVSLPTLVPPSEEFVRQANVSGMEAYRALYARALNNTEEFWGQLAEQELDWFARFEKPLEWNAPVAKWLWGGTDHAVPYTPLRLPAVLLRTN